MYTLFTPGLFNFTMFQPKNKKIPKKFFVSEPKVVRNRIRKLKKQNKSLQACEKFDPNDFEENMDKKYFHLNDFKDRYFSPRGKSTSNIINISFHKQDKPSGIAFNYPKYKRKKERKRVFNRLA